MPRGQFDRSPRKAATRARLIAAAARVFARRGFDEATLDDVAEEAGYTKGAVYGHFGSKEKLLLAVCKEHLALELEEQVELFSRGEGITERPRAGGDRWMARVEDDPDRFRLFVELWVQAQREPRLRKEFARQLGAVRTTLGAFIEQTSTEAGIDADPAQTEQVANIMFGICAGLAILRLADPTNVPSELAGSTLALVVGALTASAEARDQIGAPPIKPTPRRKSQQPAGSRRSGAQTEKRTKTK
jgi:AcrR family transcriptional regulator